MAKFYNPYHFVPVTAPAPKPAVGKPAVGKLAPVVPGETSVSRKAFQAGKPAHVTHERYVRGTHSGRLIVRLTTVTPTVIGAKQEPDKGSEHPRVHPFRIDGRAAIPASTLRGLVGSVMETASNGPLRVLEDRSYSFRRKMEESLSAIGLIVDENGVKKLKPMCLPTLESRDGGRTFAVDARFRKVFPVPQFKVFFGDKAGIRSPHFAYTTATDLSQAVAMPVKQLAWNGNAVVSDRSLHVKANRYAVAQDADSHDTPRPGLVRVLGCAGRDMPNSKTHELWIPLPDPRSAALEISPEAITRFEELADERFDSDKMLPYEPKGTRLGRDRGDGVRLRLQTGDMVYFDVDAAGKMVTEVSYSAIWRGRVEDQKTHQAASAWTFFDREQRPFNPTRETVSLAEQMLGFAEEFPQVHGQPEGKKEKGEDKKDAGLALASRLAFADALLPEGAAGEFERPVTLRILDSPKMPCPSLYFKGKDGQGAYIAKRALDPNQHAAQGRKWYLHSHVPAGQQPWATRKDGNAKQKSIVEPLKAGQSFFFHIDFDNLSNVELGLLLYALEPDAAFHHKLGMGKPLGLGTVKLEAMGCFFVDRQARYQVGGLRSGRYQAAERISAERLYEGVLPKRYAEEGGQAASDPLRVKAAREELAAAKLIPQEVHEALLLVGDYRKAPPASAVHYPTVGGQTDPEADHYKWFVFNDGAREFGRGKSPAGQFLKPLKGRKALPELEELA